jgi:hypothetical protein
MFIAHPKSDTNKMLLLKGCNCVFEVGALDFFQYGMKVLQGSHIMWQAYGVSSFEFC